MSGSLFGGTTLGLGGVPTAFSLLQRASFRFVPFSVLAQATVTGRKVAVHDYPFRDGVQTEDMGGRARVYRFTGYLIGPAGPVLERALIAAAEAPGHGLLVHPTIGARQVVCLSATTGSRVDRMRVIEVHFEFLEASETIALATVVATGVSVAAAVASGWRTSRAAFDRRALPAAAVSSDVRVEAGRVAGIAATAVQAEARSGSAVIRSVVGAEGNNGRYSSGTLLPENVAARVGSAADLLAAAAAARGTLKARADALVAAAVALGPGIDLMAAVQALFEALQVAIPDPADLINACILLTAFDADGASGSSPIAAAISTVRSALVAGIRLGAAISLSAACSSYQPTSYNDAHELQGRVSAVLDREIVTAGDARDDDAYAVLVALRTVVVADLRARGASLAEIGTVRLPMSLPAFAVAHRLYRDGRRADDLVSRVAPRHPAFLPVGFEAAL